MKKAFLILATIIMLLCTSCGSSVTAEGTWYSTEDATMYNFSDGEIKVSGVTVGQYEDNGDSLVLSLLDGNSNLQLYISTVDDVDVMVSTVDGTGTPYFCKGLENAQAIIAHREAELQQFVEYVDNNIFGTWASNAPNSPYTKIEFGKNGTVISYKAAAQAEVRELKTRNGVRVTDTSFATMVDNTRIPEITVYLSNYPSTEELHILPTQDTYTNNIIQINGHLYTKK